MRNISARAPQTCSSAVDCLQLWTSFKNTMNRIVKPLVLYDSETPTHLDHIIKSMTRRENRKRPSEFLHEAFYTMQKQQRISQIARSASGLEAEVPATPNGWMCRGCGETDSSKLQESSDKSGFACPSCGACEPTNSNFQEKTYDTNNRSTVVSDDKLATDLAAEEFKSSAARRRARQANEAASQGVPSALRGTQEKITRAAAAASLDVLQQRDKKRMDRTIVHVHSVFSSAGFDPDTNPLCASASKIVTRLFVKTASHILSCPNNKNGCFASMIRLADPKLIASASIKHVVEEAHKLADSGEAFEQIGPFEVRQMTTKLLQQITGFTKSVSVVRDSLCAIERILDASPGILCLACKEQDDDVDDEDAVLDEECASLVLAPHEEDRPSFPSVDQFLQQIALSIEASKNVGWIDERTAEMAQKHVVGIACYDWISRNATWPPDIVSAIVSIKVLLALKLPTSNMRKIMKKSSKRYKIYAETLQRELDAFPMPGVSGVLM